MVFASYTDKNRHGSTPEVDKIDPKSTGDTIYVKIQKQFEVAIWLAATPESQLAA
jgi:hypothetical protein